MLLLLLLLLLCYYYYYNGASHLTFTNSSQKSNGTVAFKRTSNFRTGGSVFAGT